MYWGVGGLGVCVHTSCRYRSEVNLAELTVSFYHPGSRNQTQGIRLGRKHLCPLNYLTESSWL